MVTDSPTINTTDSGAIHLAPFEKVRSSHLISDTKTSSRKIGNEVYVRLRSKGEPYASTTVDIQKLEDAEIRKKIRTLYSK